MDDATPDAANKKIQATRPIPTWTNDVAANRTFSISTFRQLPRDQRR